MTQRYTNIIMFHLTIIVPLDGYEHANQFLATYVCDSSEIKFRHSFIFVEDNVWILMSVHSIFIPKIYNPNWIFDSIM